MSFWSRFFPAKSAAPPEKVGEKTAPLFVPPGHYYSPIVDPEQLVKKKHDDRIAADALLGVNIDDKALMAVFDRLKKHFDAIDFPDLISDTHRYYFKNDFYTYGDAIILSSMIREFRPARIVEVGSGFSSAVILDTIEAVGDLATTCVFVEPYPHRLYAVMRDNDRKLSTVIESPVQNVPMDVFESLGANDFLFFDTTHVVKTGSDVVHELFEIIPRLKPGVIVHFHDVFDQFEYPDVWVFGDNRSWNELYTLRAFLMYNSKVEIVYFNHMVAKRHPDQLRAASEKSVRNPGGGLWLRIL